MRKHFSAKIKTIATKYFSLCQQRLLLFLRLQYHSLIGQFTRKNKKKHQQNYLNINISKSPRLLEAGKHIPGVRNC